MNVKLLELDEFTAGNGAHCWRLHFTGGRVMEVRSGMIALVAGVSVITREDVKRRCFEIYDRPVRFMAQIVSCAELWDADRRASTPPPFNPPRSWDAQSDGDQTPGATA